MKYIELFEENLKEELINYPFVIDEQINFIIEPWKEILRIRSMIIQYDTKLAYMNIFEEINDKTFNDFNNFFKTLKKFDLYFKFTDTKNSNAFRIDYANMNEKKLKLEMEKEKYNI